MGRGVFMFKKRKRRVIWIHYVSKMKFVYFLLVLALVTGILVKGFPIVKTWTGSSPPLSDQTIVIDPGHGGFDRGAVNEDGVFEKNINLTISSYLRDFLQQAGAMVVMTRESDVDLSGNAIKNKKTIDLNNRVNIAKEGHANLLVSIHLNSFGAKWQGAQTFYHLKSEESKRLASLIQNEFQTNLNTDRKALTGDLFILRSTNLPAVLVEAGFLSNPEESKILQRKDYQMKVAESIYLGILRFYDEEEVG